MPIYTIAQLRASAPEEFRDLPDIDLVNKYSQTTGMSFEDAANYFGVKPRGTLSEMGRQLYAGAVSDLPKMVGQGLEYTGVAPEYGREMAQAAEARGADYNPDMRNRGLIGQALVYGARGVAPVAAVAPLTLIPGVGEIAAGAGAAALFGTSSAQETYDKMISQGASEADATAAARRVGLIQGPLEGIATTMGMRTAKGLAPLVGLGGKTAAGVAGEMTETAVAKPFLKGMATNMVVQPGTEVAQDLGTYAVEQAYGANPENPYEIAKQSALGGAGLTMLLGPLALGGHAARSRNAAQLKQALYGEDTPTEVRAQALDAVLAEAKRQGVADADVDQWFDAQLNLEDARLAKLKEIENDKTNQFHELTKGITTKAEPVDLQAHIDALLGITPRADQLQEVDLIGGAAAKPANYISGARGLSTQGEQLTQVETKAPVANGIIESAPGIYYTQPAAPVDLTNPTLGREMPRQEAPTRPTLSQIRTGMFQTPILNSQQALAEEEGGPLAAGPAVGQQIAPLAAPGGVQPATPVVAGASLQGTQNGAQTAQAVQAKTQGSKQAAIAGTVVKVNGKDYTLTADQAREWNQAAQTNSGPALTAARRRIVGDLTVKEREAIAAERNRPTTPAQLAEGEEADIAAAQSAIDELGLRPLAGDAGAHLQASVRGGSIKIGGRPSFDAPTLAKASGAFIDGKTDKEAKTPGGKLAKAARDFGDKYLAYLNAAGNMVPSERKDKEGNVIPLKPMRGSKVRGDEAVAAERADASVAKVRELWIKAQDALSVLGEASGNNAKNVEAMIRLVKDKLAVRKAEIDKRMEATEDGDEMTALVEEMKGLEKLDIGLSQGWASAKRGIFRNNADILDVRGGEIRTSKEEQKQGFEQPLVRAAKYGASVGPRSPAQTGFQGVLNYIRSKGTPFERMLAKAVSEVFKNTSNPPQLVFAEGNPKFDPNKNTVTLSPTASPEVALHEALHAALQWYVHKHPNDPIVRQLLKSVDQVVKFDTSKLSPKAAEVQAVLAKLTKEKNNLDAVLELISYGNTLVEFRKALESMPSKGTPESFVKAAKDVWNMILATVRRMLGLKDNSAASDVIMSSFRLLEQAASTKYESVTSNILEAAVTSTKPVSDAKVAEALGRTKDDYSQWNKSNGVQLQLTQRLFEAVGWNEANMKKLTGAAGDKMRAFISKNFPGTEIVLGWINSRYNVSETVSRIMDNFKLDKGIGYQYAEDLANVIARRPAEEVNAVFAYLDGNKRALDKMPDADKLKAVADKLQDWFKLYVAELTPVEQQWFNSRKFSETLLFPEHTEQVAGNTFGLGHINEVLGIKNVGESELDQNWFRKDDNGDLILTGDMYRVFQPNKATGTNEMIPAGFMSASRFAELGNKNPMGFTVDTSRRWTYGGMKNGQHSFTTNTTAKEKIDNQKADDVANALRNTIAALANNYASHNFIRAVYGMGREGSAHAQVAFDSLADVNKFMNEGAPKGQRVVIQDSQVLQVSREISRSPQTKALYRQSGTWVKLPEKSPVYGELAGKYIPGPVWNAMVDMSDRQPLVNLRAVNNTMRWFKKSKTVWNFGTHVTNTASNVTMAMMHDISFGTMLDASKILSKYEVNPKLLTKDELALVMAFRDSGAMLADYSSAEVKEALYKAHAQNLRGGEDVSLMRRVGGWLGIEKAKAEWLQAQAKKVGGAVDKMDDIAAQMYAAEDNIFRMAAFLKTAGALQARAGLKAATPEMMREAGLFARKAFGDYDIDSKAVKVARQTVMPFVSWFYAMAPVIGRIAVYEPWKLVNVLGAYMILEAAMGGAAGDDDEETRKLGPESIRERMFGSVGPYTHIRVPFMGSEQNPVYYKLGDYFPLSSFTRGLPNGLMGQSWIPASLTPSGPFISGVLGLVGGVDPYTGKSLHKPTDTEWQKLWTSAKFAYDTATIPMVNSRTLGKVQDIVDEKTGITGAEPSSLPIARAFGLKFYDYDVDEQAAINDMAVKRIEHDFKSAMTAAKRDEYRKAYPDYDALDATLDDLYDRMEKEIAKARGGVEE